jgi:PqqD family protein of HPr-rel-A system
VTPDRVAALLPTARPELDVRPAGGETLVHDPTSGKVHVLNGLAARILARCDGTTSVAAVVDEIVAGTGAPRERVALDVTRLCDDFRALGLVG